MDYESIGASHVPAIGHESAFAIFAHRCFPPRVVSQARSHAALPLSRLAARLRMESYFTSFPMLFHPEIFEHFLVSIRQSEITHTLAPACSFGFFGNGIIMGGE